MSDIDVSIQVDSILSRIKPRYAEALRLRYWHCMTYKQVGKELGVSQDRARQIIHKAIHNIRKEHYAEARAALDMCFESV